MLSKLGSQEKCKSTRSELWADGLCNQCSEAEWTGIERASVLVTSRHPGLQARPRSAPPVRTRAGILDAETLDREAVRSRSLHRDCRSLMDFTMDALNRTIAPTQQFAHGLRVHTESMRLGYAPDRLRSREAVMALVVGTSEPRCLGVEAAATRGGRWSDNRLRCDGTCSGGKGR